MITFEQYFGKWLDHPSVSQEKKDNAIDLLACVNRLLDAAGEVMINLPINPATKSQVSGSTYGGYRPPECPQGSSRSSHKEGQGIDIYDPHDDLDSWLTDELLEEFGLYREHPTATHTWCHLTRRPPGSHKRTFLP